jgi:hypothetical protein
MNSKTSKLATLLSSASFLTLVNAMSAQAQQAAQAQVAQAAPMEVPEQVLITGSLIHGTAAVGVPVTNLSTFRRPTSHRAPSGLLPTTTSVSRHASIFAIWTRTTVCAAS